MVVTILFMLLILLGAALVLFFLFFVFLPSLHAQQVNTSNPLFSQGEFNAGTLSPANTKGESSGMQADEGTGRKAVVLCSSRKVLPDEVLHYSGTKNCRLFLSLYDGVYSCIWSCIGFGDCVSACPRYAISIENGTAVVQASCNGCGACIPACPKDIIRLVPPGQPSELLCGKPSVLDVSEDVSCSASSVRTKLPPEGKKLFKFWQKCYRIIYGSKAFGHE